MQTQLELHDYLSCQLHAKLKKKISCEYKVQMHAHNKSMHVQ